MSAWRVRESPQPVLAVETGTANNPGSADKAGLGAALVVERMACSFPRVALKSVKPAPVTIAAGPPAINADDPMLRVFVEELPQVRLLG